MAAGELEETQGVLPEGTHVVIEELAAVVGVDLQDGEGQTRENARERVSHDQETATQDGSPFAPARSHVDHLDRTDVLTRGAGATMMHQVDLEVAGNLFVPRDAPHGDISGDAVGRARSPARQ